MKYTITIEETVAKDFEIEANSAEEAYEMAEQNINPVISFWILANVSLDK
jgi:hypothetical protein